MAVRKQTLTLQVTWVFKKAKSHFWKCRCPYEKRKGKTKKPGNLLRWVKISSATELLLWPLFLETIYSLINSILQRLGLRVFR
jgi:hypothetical protein